MTEIPTHLRYDQYSQVREHGLDEDPRPWNFLEEVEGHLPKSGLVLDAGTGTAFKLVEIQKRGGTEVQFVGFDLNPVQLTKAQAVVRQSEFGNISLVQADILPTVMRFPFPGSKFETVTFMLSKHNASEAYRVLKPGGVAIMERVGEMEKREAKLYFGNDENGKPRGYLAEHEPGSLIARYKADFQRAGFKPVEAREGKWITRYTPKGLQTLMQNTPFVRNYNLVDDKPILDKIIQNLTNPESGKVELTQHRILVVAKK